jgi:hypothetical protein
MSLKHIDGFDQYQGQSGQALLTSLTSAGYAVSSGLGMAAGRKAGTYALELQVSAGAAGSSWSSRTNTIKVDLHGVASNTQGRFVAVGVGGAATTTTDGIQWSPLVLGVNADMNDIACNAGTFIAVGDGGTILRSTDGQTWSPRSAPNGTANLEAVAYGNARWLAVGAVGSAGCVFVSDDDGVSWSSVTQNPGARGNLSVVYAGDTWIVGGAQGQIITSTTGDNFTTRAFGATGDVNGIAYDNGTLVAINGRSLRRSVDKGVTWASAGDNIITSGSFYAIAAADGRWVVGGSQVKLFISDDTTTWTPPAFTGAYSQATIYSIDRSTGTQVGWCLVGSRNGSQTTSTALIYVSLAPPTTVTRTFTSTQSRVVIGFAHMATARGRIFSIAGLFDMDWPAGIQILDTAGASVPIRNTWYYYEIVIDKVAGTLSLFVNDTADLSVALPGAAAAMTDYVCTWESENGAVARIDDLYFLDSEVTGGSTLTNRLKPVTIPVRMPTADVDVNWDGSDVGPHYALVGLLPPSSASYVRSATSGAQDLYSSNAALPAGAGTESAPILAVGVIALAQKSDLDARQLGLVVGSPGNQKEVVDTTLSTTMEYSFAIFETGPGNQAWTADSVLNTPFGIAVRP